MAGCGCSGACECSDKITFENTQTLELTNFTDAKRAKLAKKGEAMPGGGFPIRNVSDLHHAIEAIGRAKNPEAAKAWIKKRAADLGATDQLPATWELSIMERIEAAERAVIALGVSSLS